MTQDEYWRMYDAVQGDLDITISSITTYLTIRHMASEDREVLDALNRQGEFWRITSYALQEAFFLGLGRLFDKTPNTISVEDVVDATVEYPGFFTREELRKRKLSSIHLGAGESEPEWLANFVDKAWQPGRGDLEYLKKKLQPHVEHFRRIYRPIRHQYFAHRSKLSEAAIGELFENAVISQSIEILKFLAALTRAIRNLAWNGERPDLRSSLPYEEYAELIEGKARDLINQLRND